MPRTDSSKAIGCGRQGFMDISYAELVAALGPPDSDGDGYKTDAEWAREEGGVIFTIYNYKTGPNYMKCGTIDAVRDWHIGGLDGRAVIIVRCMFPNANVQEG